MAPKSRIFNRIQTFVSRWGNVMILISCFWLANKRKIMVCQKIQKQSLQLLSENLDFKNEFELVLSLYLALFQILNGFFLGSHQNSHRWKAVLMPLDWLWLQIFKVWWAYQAQEKASWLVLQQILFGHL